MTVPAEELRTAAKLMRERAQASTPGPWKEMCLGSEGCQVLRANGTVRERGRGRVARFGQKEWKADHADAEYVAGMHPGVALAVADWLEQTAESVSRAIPRPSGLCHACGGMLAEDCCCGWDEALRVARAYLGTEGETP